MPQAPASSQRPSAFVSPPGLEDAIHKMHETVQAAARENVETRLGQIGSCENRQEWVETVRQVVHEDVEQMITDKCSELLQQGKQKLAEAQQRNRDKDIKLEADVEFCLQRQRNLEQENKELKDVLARLSTTFDDGKDLANDSVLSKVVGTPLRKASVEEAAGGRESRAIPDFPFGDGDARGREAPKTPDRAPGGALACSPFATPGKQVVVLADAIGPRTPVNIANHLGPEASPSPAVPLSPAVLVAGDGSVSFTFTLRKADGNDLGLTIAPMKEEDAVLRIEGIQEGGAVQAWNRLWLDGPKASKAVLPGDSIVSANSVTGDPAKMLAECKEKQLVSLTIRREPAATTLNPAASEFVPRGSLAPFPDGLS